MCRVERAEKQEMLAEIVAVMRRGFDQSWHDINREWAYGLADRIEAAWKREANSIERLVRDAIIDYQEMFAHAPNDDAERDLIDRAERGNAWLVANGYEPEQLSWSKEESPCL